MTTSPPGTYLPSGATVPVADPGGYYSTGDGNLTLDPAGTYSSPYALNRLIIGWQEYLPSNISLAFNNLTAVENWFGVGSLEAKIAKQFFAPNTYGTAYSDAGATLYFTREGLGQRPHLLGTNLGTLSWPNSKPSMAQWRSTSTGGLIRRISTYLPPPVFLAPRRSSRTQLNAQRPVLAQTTGDTISSQTVDFTGDFKNAQLNVVSVQSGTMEIGGQFMEME